MVGPSSNRTGVVARLKNDGSGLDETFGEGGRLLLPVIPGSVTVDAFGRIVLGGSVAGNGFDFWTARLTAGGALDQSFGLGGYASADIDNSDDFAYSVTTQADCSIIAAGTTSAGGTT